MKLKEFFKNIDKRHASGVGVNKFRFSLDKESLKTPHFCMQKCEDMINNRPSIMNGLRQLVLFTMPDVTFSSDDEKTSVFSNEWLEQRNSMKREINYFVKMVLGVGNGYLEPYYIKKTNGQKVLDNLYNVPTPSSIYLNPNAKDESDFWIVEYPYEVQTARNKNLTFHHVSYVRGSQLHRQNVWGIKLHKDELIQLKFLWSPSPFYGNGLLTPAIDNEDIAEEILKNWALAAKYRSLSKKILGFYNEDGESVDPNEIDDIRDELNSLEEEDSLLVNKKFVAEDLTFTGADNMMNSELEFLRRDSGSSLTPNYMTAFSQDSSLATASEAKVPFSLSLDAIQEMIEDFLNDVITKNLLEAYPFLQDDLRLKLGKADLYSRSETFMNMSQLYNMRACTFNELRKAAGLDTVEGGDRWGEDPPLDNTEKTVTEKINNKKALREKYSEVLKKCKPPKQITKQENLVFKPKEDMEKDKSKRFSESVKEMFYK